MKRLMALCTAATLAACSAVSPLVPPGTKANPDTVAKLNYVCAYSGLFKLVAGGASLIPVPFVGAAISLAEQGAVTICNDTVKAATDIADGEAVVKQVIASFKAGGRM